VCGIFGRVNLDGRPVDATESVRILDILAHRGPDDRDYYHKDNLFLGHRRLSIIDVSGGRQPIFNEDGTLFVICNGEIYNYPELRDRLLARGHRFRTRSDSEALVHLFEDEGPRSVEALNGMFAYVICDTRSGSLFVARDRIGIKPLYYYTDGKQFLFSSEMKAIIKSGLIPARVDERVVYQFLTLHHSMPPDTLIEGLKSLRPAHYMTVDGTVSEQIPYWDIEPSREAPRRSERETLEEVEWLIADSVEKELMSDVPLGLFLSGGVDSSLIAVLMHRIVGSGIKTFSIGFEEKRFSELPYARRVSDQIASDHREIVITPRDMIDAIGRVVWFRETPISEPSDIPIYYLSKAAAEQVKVVLTGEGGDEAFCGYYKYVFERVASRFGFLAVPAARLDARVPGVLPQRMSKALRLLAERDRYKRFFRWFGYFDERELAAMVPPEKRAALMGNMDVFAETARRKGFRDSVDELEYLDFKVWLPDNLLLRGDRLSMASGLEARVPFLDHRIVELAFTIPSRMKIKRMQSKYLVKRIAAKYLPRDLIYREKVGFTVPIGGWLRGELRELLVSHLTRGDSFCAGFVDRAAVKRLIDEHISGARDHHKKLWILLNLELWRDAFLGGAGTGAS
jgi:asparagine synthase (glutamine-hydrolysing)